MKKRTALYAALICTIMTGCSLKSPVSETVTEPESTAETESAEIPQTPAETTAPPTIEEFPHEGMTPLQNRRSRNLRRAAGFFWPRISIISPVD